MMVITKSVALFLCLFIFASGAKKGHHTLFVKQTKSLQCHKIETITHQSPTVANGGAAFCTLSCIQSQTKTCICAGWRKENGGCKMCFECRGGGSTTTFNATYTPYDPRTEADLYQSCDNILTGDPNINAPLASPGTGTRVGGKKNNAFRAVISPTQQEMFNFTVPNTLCRNNLAICTQGVTFAFWLKISNNTGWSTQIAPETFVYTNCFVMQFFNGNLSMMLTNKATGIWKQENVTMRFNEWVHYAITWDNPSDVMSVYENGVFYGNGADFPVTAPPTSKYWFMGTKFYVAEIDEYYTFEEIKHAKFLALIANA